MAEEGSKENAPMNESQVHTGKKFADSAKKSESSLLSNPILPYLVADVLFLGTALGVLIFGSRPMTIIELIVITFCVTAGAWVMIYPFKRRADIDLQLAQNRAINQSVAKLSNLESLVARIESASGNWSGIQEKAEQCLGSSKEMAEAMIKESESFKQFLETATNEELQHLRLLLDKMKKAEKDWANIIMAMLDHSTALKWAAKRSNNPNLIEQITNFQAQQVEIARQIGLVIFEPNTGDTFDEEIHQPASSDEVINNGDIIALPRSAGFKFRGVILRKALVSCNKEDQTQFPGPATSSTINPVEATGSKTFQSRPADTPTHEADDDDPQQSLL